MSLQARLQSLADRLDAMLPRLDTEEATKTALVLPFIAALGYDIFNPMEVIPEFTADVGLKKGEKIDYAIMRESEVIILIECKKVTSSLANAEFSQLYRYFSVTKARIAILTNGIEYRFFSDLEEPNILDTLPFLEIDIRDIKETQLAEVTKLGKENFDLERMLLAAADLKYISAVKHVLAQQITDPSAEFVKFFFTAVFPDKRFVESAQKEFTPVVQRALSQFVSEQVGRRLRSALEQEDIAAGNTVDPTAPVPEPDDGIETTEEEIEGFHIVKAICREVVNSTRLGYRDSKSYMAVLLDDNNRRPICRLHFNRSQKYLGVLDVDKNETRHAIDSLDDIYKYADELRAMAIHWANS